MIVRLLFCAFLLLNSHVSLGDNTLTNGLISISLKETGLTAVEDLTFKRNFLVLNDGFEIIIKTSLGNNIVLNYSNMKFTSTDTSPTAVSFLYTHTDTKITVKIVYELLENWHFFSKLLQIFVPSQIGDNYMVTQVTPYSLLEFKELFKEYFVKTENPCGRTFPLALFLRATDSAGIFALIQNPFFTVDLSKTNQITLSYVPNVNSTSAQWINFDMALIGTYKLGKYWLPGSQVNPSERDAFSATVDKFLISPPTTATNKVHVAWDASDYQMDVTTTQGRTEYFRIIDRIAQFGITHVVTSQTNSDVATRANATDSWGWEETLWLCLGEQIREGYWYPGKNEIPNSVQVMLDYAKSKGVSWMAYVYPILAFSASDEWLFEMGGRTYASLANTNFQNWLLKTLMSFQKVTGVGGFSFDYTFFNDPHHSEYSQWKGWMNIVQGIRLQNPDLKIDHRQLAHCYGPWHVLAGSYTEPLASDENPETYPLILPDLSTDRVAALMLRSVNFWYRQEIMLPMNVVPGFAFHQQERYYANGTMAWDDWLIRDFDYLGYKYSLLSNIATAGINIVLTMLPARDLSEFTLFPQEDVKFIQNWLKWTDQKIEYLRNTVPILNSPGPDKVDGTVAFLNNEGFMFLFNPNYLQKGVILTLDESVNLYDDGGNWLISEIYPQIRNLFVKKYGDTVTVTMDGTSARVFEFTKWNPKTQMEPILFNVSGQIKLVDTSISILNVEAEAGTSQDVAVFLPSDPTAISDVTVNGKNVKWTTSGQLVIIPNIMFSGNYFPHSAQIMLKQSGNTYSGRFIVPSSVKEQLITRHQTYPVDWQPVDNSATWLISERLLLFITILSPSDAMKISITIDGKPVNVQKGYETRDHIDSNRFAGFYADISQIIPDVEHVIQLDLPALGPNQKFLGVFFEHVETIFTTEFEQT